MDKELLIIVITALLLITGVFGSLLPALPGPQLSFIALLVYGFFTDFRDISALWLIVFGVLTIGALLIDFFAPALGAKGYNATRKGIIGSILGAFFGVFVFGPVGILLGPFIGGFIGEYIAHKNTELAFRSAWGAFVGFLIGTAIKLSVSVGMVVYFIYLLIN